MEYVRSCYSCYVRPGTDSDLFCILLGEPQDIFFIGVLTTPSALLLCVVLVTAWMAFLNKNSDPNWSPRIGGIVTTRTQRMLAMALVSGALVGDFTLHRDSLCACVQVLILAGGLIVTVLCLSGVLAVAHATFNSGVGKFEELAEGELPLNSV